MGLSPPAGLAASAVGWPQRHVAGLDHRRALRGRSGRILAKSWTRGRMREGGNAK